MGSLMRTKDRFVDSVWSTQCVPFKLSEKWDSTRIYCCSSGCLEFPSKLGVSLQSSGELSFPGIPTGWQSPGSPRKPQAGSSAQAGAALGSAGTQLCGGVAVSLATSHMLLGTSRDLTVPDLTYSCFRLLPTRRL